MRSKAPLTLMEQMVMLLVFALAAALCLQAFVKSDQISLKSQAKGNAALAAQNTAEYIRSSGGDLEHALGETADRQGGKYLENGDKAGGSLIISYNEDWKPVLEGGSYLLRVNEIPAEEKGLKRVLIQVADIAALDTTEQGALENMAEMSGLEILFELETAWLEVEGHE